MNCDRVQENLSAYLDGELDPEEENALRLHLEGCTTCSAQLESLRSTVRLVGSLPRIDAPAALMQRLQRATAGRRPAFRLLNPAAVLTGAALVLVALVAVFMLAGEQVPVSRDGAETISRASDKLDEARAPETPPEGYRHGKLAGEEAPKLAQETDTLENAQVAQIGEYKQEETLEGFERKLGRELKKFNDLSRLAEEQKQDLGKESGAGDRAARSAGEADPGVGALEYGEAVAEARKPLERARLRPGGSAQAPPEDEEGEHAQGKVTGRHVEEYVLETDDVGDTAEAVRELLRTYLDDKDAEDKAESKEFAGTAKGGKKPETVILLVEVDGREYREILAKLTALEGRRKKQVSPGVAKTDPNKDAAERKWSGAGQKEAEKPDAEPEPERRRGAQPRVPAAGSGGGRGAAAPVPSPDREPDESDRLKDKKSREEKTVRKKLKKMVEDALKAPIDKPVVPPRAPAPAGRPDRDEEAHQERITLRIRIVRSGLPAAEIPAKKKESEPAAGQGK